MPMDWIQKKSCTRFDWSNSIDLGTHNDMESLENLTTFNRRDQTISEKQSSWRWFKVQRLICLNLSWHGIAPQDHGMYLAWWNPLRCVKIPHHCRHVGYKVAKPTACDYHFTQKKYDKRKISSHNPQEGSSQTSHSRISSGHSNTLNMPPKILLLFSSSMERHRRPCFLLGNLSEMFIPSLECLSSMHDAQLVWKSSCTMECSFALSIWETFYACTKSPYGQLGLSGQRTWFQQFE